MNYEEGVTPSKFQGITYHLYHSTQRSNYFTFLVASHESSVTSERATATVLIDPESNSNSKSAQFLSKDEKDSNFTITFIEHSLRLQSYSLKARIDERVHMPKEWVLEGSTDGTKWVEIHYHEYNEDLNRKGAEMNYVVNSSHFFRAFRVTQKGKNSGNNSITF